MNKIQRNYIHKKSMVSFKTQQLIEETGLSGRALRQAIYTSQDGTTARDVAQAKMELRNATDDLINWGLDVIELHKPDLAQSLRDEIKNGRFGLVRDQFIANTLLLDVKGEG